VPSTNQGHPELPGRTQEYRGVRSETFLDIGVLVFTAASAAQPFDTIVLWLFLHATFGCTDAAMSPEAQRFRGVAVRTPRRLGPSTR
jgi:hypothetical protein